MPIIGLRAALVSTVSVAALVAGASSPALAADFPDPPVVVSADLVSATGDGCDQPGVQLGDGWLGVRAQTGGDSSLQLTGPATAVGCVLRVHLEFDQPATVRPAQYLMSGWVATSAGTQAGHSFESSFDGTTWYGQNTTLPAGSSGPFARGGGSRFDPWSDCATALDLSFRVGLSLTGPSAGDSIGLDATAGASAELAPAACG
jgi:hypothetical protein